MNATRSHPTRRGLIAGGAATLVAGALVPVTAAPAFQMDRALIDLLYVQEQTLMSFYAAVLQNFDEAAFAGAGLPEHVRSGVEEILAAEEAHQAVVTRPDGPRMVGTDSVIPGDLPGALREAVELENLAVATYAFVISELGRERLIPELLGIHSVEARHAAWLATLVGEEPFPNPIDSPLVLEESSSAQNGPVAPTAAGGTPVAETEAAPIVAAVAQELNLSVDNLTVVSVTRQTWPDASLGCPQPDMLYAQVVTPGFLVVVEIAGEQVEFHTDERGNVVRCP